MDPQKLPSANRPEDDTKTPNPNDAANDISMSEESSVPPGTVVVGGPANPDTDMGPKPPEPPSTDPDVSQPAAPSPDSSQDNMAAFMREPSTASDVPPAPKTGAKKTGMIIGIVAAVLLVFGGAAAAYWAFMMPKPDKILQTALVNTFSKDKVKTVGFEGDATITDTSSDSTFTLDFNGAAGENGQMSLTANLHIPMLSPVSFDLLSVDGETAFAKVSGVADIATLLETDPSVAIYAPLLATIDNQWYEIDPTTLEQFAGDTSASTSTTISDADRQKLADAYNQNQFLSVKETLADEKIAGVDSYHYKVGLDSAKFKAFLSAVEGANIESLGTFKPLLDSLKASADQASFQNTPVDVWIAKDSKVFTQFAYKFQSGETTVDLTLTLKDYNKEVKVEEPEGAEPIMNVITSFYQTLLGTGLGSDVPDNMLQ